MTLSKNQKELLKKMQFNKQYNIYIGYLGVEGLGKYGMSIAHKIRRGTASAFIRNGLAVEINEQRVELTELGKSIQL